MSESLGMIPCFASNTMTMRSASASAASICFLTRENVSSPSSSSRPPVSTSVNSFSFQRVSS